MLSHNMNMDKIIANNENTQTVIFRSRSRERLTIFRETKARTNPGIHPQGNIRLEHSYEIIPTRANKGRKKNNVDMTIAINERKKGKIP